MGITNLLKELSSITKSVHLSHFRGQKCGVDASCWLHRASYSCAIELVSGQPTDKYLKFTLRCIKTLLHYGITPIIVFDGARLPIKANEEHRRNKIRDENKTQALEYIKSGKRNEAWKYAAAAVRVTQHMVTCFINQCIKHNIQYICAPYEADSQLGYMFKKSQIDFVISEDSDIVLFGAKRVLYKFDVEHQRGDLVNMDEINEYVGDEKNKSDLCLFLKKFWIKDHKELIRVCVLSGCDYVKNIPGIGIKTAIKYCTENREIDCLLQTLMRDKVDAPKDYLIQFNRAVLTFLHQRVYDMDSHKLVHLNPLAEDVEKYFWLLTKYMSKYDSTYDFTLNFLGKEMDGDTAKMISKGIIGARNLLPLNLESDHVASMEMDAKEHSEVVMNDEDELMMDLSRETSVFTVEYWRMLWQYDPDLYQERYQTKQDQEKSSLWQKWNAIIQRIVPDGNCVCEAMLTDLGIEINSDTLMLLRKLLNKYCKLKIPEFTIRFGNDVEKFSHDKILLEEDHYFAYYKLFHRNLIVLEYHEEHDDCSMKIWFNPNFQHSLYLLYHQIPNSETCAGHIDYLTMPEIEFNLNNLGLKCGFNYIVSTHNDASEQKHSDLNKFDIKNELPYILFDRSKIYQAFGKQIGDRLANTNIFPIKHLLEMSQLFNLSETDFGTNTDQAIQKICDCMKQYHNIK